MLSFLSAMLGEHTVAPAEKEEQVFRAALDAVPVAVLLTDAERQDHPAIYVNARYCRMMGYPPEEVVGCGLGQLLGQRATADAGFEQMKRDLAAGRSATADLVASRKDGSPLPLRIEILPVVNSGGMPIRHVAVLHEMTDTTTDRPRAGDIGTALRLIADVVPLPLLVVNPQGRIIVANAQARGALCVGHAGGRALGEFIDLEQDLAVVRRGGGVQRAARQLRNADGQIGSVLVSVRALDEGADAGIVIVFTDITEQKRKEQGLVKACEDAERAIRAKSRFFAAASHDLRQPLQALALFSTALEMHVSTPAAQNILSSIKLSLSTMEDMFDTLLDMSRLDAGVLKAEPEVFLVNDVLERLEVEFAPQAERKGLDFRVVACSAAIRSDPALLGRILRNFLSNAIRYTQTGKILLGCRRQGSNLQVLVGDTGPGIPENQRLAIFEEFFQGTERQGASGLGLGLAIVQRLARLLSHRLGLRSRLGHGSIFSVEVPLTEPPMPLYDEDDAEEALGDLSGSKVLVVDDDPAVREGLAMLLADWGCLVTVVSSGTEALALVQRQNLAPDIILADCRLPQEGGGATTIEHLRAAVGRDLPAFLFTGDTDVRDAAVPMGDSSRLRVLHKPISPLRLRAALAEAMGRTPAGG